MVFQYNPHDDVVPTQNNSENSSTVQDLHDMELSCGESERHLEVWVIWQFKANLRYTLYSKSVFQDREVV